jgi:tetratricopeptide (TPR) repeat protein
MGTQPRLRTPWSIARVAVVGSLLMGSVVAGCAVLTVLGIHVPGTRTIEAVTSLVLAPFRKVEASFVPPPESDRPGPTGQLIPSETPTFDAAPDCTSECNADGGRADVRDTVTPPAQVLPPPPTAGRVKSGIHIWQTWNNCGPATITMALSVFGRAETQKAAAAFLKPNPNDKNVDPSEMVRYVRSLGVRTEWRVAGDLTTLKRLIAQGIPVVVEVGFEPTPGDWMGHYRLLVAYDDVAGRFMAFDSYLAPGMNVPQPYPAFDGNWKAFNRTYLPIYLPEQADTVEQIAGPTEGDGQFVRAVSLAQREVVSQPEDKFAWFNLGTSFIELGRVPEAVQAFDQARRLKLPRRMLWYQFGPFEAYLAAGRITDVISLASTIISETTELEESHYYLGRAYSASGQFDEARASFRRALDANPGNDAAKRELAALTR